MHLLIVVCVSLFEFNVRIEVDSPRYSPSRKVGEGSQALSNICSITAKIFHCPFLLPSRLEATFLSAI